MKLFLVFTCFVLSVAPHWQAAAADASTNSAVAVPAASGTTNSPVFVVSQFDPAARNIRFQFDGMPYQDVLERFAQMVQKPLIAETNVQGTLSFSDPRPYAYSEALDTLNLILSMKQVMLVESGHYLRLVPFQRLSQMAFQVFHGLEEVKDVSPGEIVTVVLNLKNLEASETAQSVAPMLSEAGSVAPLSRGRGLIITDRLANIERVRGLLSKIDNDSLADRQMRTYTLLHSPGAVLADMLNKTFGVATAPSRTVFNQAQKKYEVLPPDPSDYVAAIFDEPSRTLVVYGPRDRVNLAEELIKKFEIEDGSKSGEVRIFTPRWTKADVLAVMLRQAIPGIAATNETATSAAIKARLVVDPATNRLIATGPVASQLDQIDALIQQIDQPPTAAQSSDAPTLVYPASRVFHLERSDPDSVLRILSNALSNQSDRNPRGNRGNPSEGPAVSVDANTRSVVVTGSPIDIQRASEILQQLEDNPAAEEETMFISIGSAAEVKRLAPLIDQIYRRDFGSRSSNFTGSGRRRFGEPPARVVSDVDSGRLIVTGVPSQIKRIESIVTLLRQQPDPTKARQLHIRPFQFVKVEAVFKSVNELVTERLRDQGTTESLRPLLLADSGNNRLMVTANEDQWAVIEPTIAAFDVAAKNVDRELQIIPLRTKSPQELVPLVTQLAAQTQNEGARQRPEPKILSDANAKQLIVLAASEDQERIKGIVEQLDGGTSDRAARQLRVFEANSRAASELVPLLEKMYKEQLVGQPAPAGGPASFVAEPKSNRILMNGSEPEIARAKAILGQIDPIGSGDGDETRVVRLENAIAGELAGLVEKTVSTQRETCKVLVDTRSNSIVLTGPSRTVQLALHIVHQLDVKGSRQPREIRIIELRGSQASLLAPILTQLYAEIARDIHGPAYTVTARIWPDERGNRLVATGDGDELDEIEKLVRQIDLAEDNTARVFKLKRGRASDLAQVLSNALVQRTRSYRTVPRVNVTADRTSNSLIVSGSKADLEDAAQLIEELDQEAQLQSPAIRIIDLKNADPSQTASLASRFFRAQQSQQPGIDGVQITPQPNSKRLVLLAPEPLLAPLMELITQLDELPPEAARELHFVETKAAPARDIIPIVNRVFQEQNRGRDMIPPSLYPVGERRLSVIGSEAQAKEIEKVVDTLQSRWQSKGARETRIFPIGPTEEVRRLEPLVMRLYQDELRGLDPSDPADAQILSDTANGRLIVTARTNHLERISELIDRLRTAPGETPVSMTRVYDLESANAQDLASTTRSLFENELKGKSGFGPSKALILPDSASNRLIVSGTSAELEIIERLVKTLDAVSTQSTSTRIFQLRSATAQQIASILSTTFVQISRYGRTLPRVSVGVDQANNTLLVSGKPKDLESVASIIEELENKHLSEPRAMRILPLQSGTATDLVNKLRQLYTDRVKSERQSGTPAPFFLGDDTSNRLIITASDSQMKIIEEMIGKLEEGGASVGHQLRLFFLGKNSAGALAAIASQVFAREMRGADPASRPVITASPDDRTLVVDADPKLLDRIETLVRSLDDPQAGSGREVRTYHLPEASANELAPALTRLFNEGNSRRRGPPEARFEADAASNTLIVAAPRELFEEIEGLIKRLNSRVELAQEIRTFSLSHLDAQEASGILDELLGRGGRSGYRSSRSRWQSFSSTEEVRVTAAPALNAVLVQAPQGKLALAEEILRSIDKPQTDQLNSIRAVHLVKAQADAVAQAVNQTLGGRQGRNPSRRVSVTAVPSSNSVLLNGSPEEIEIILKLIQELDSESAETGEEVRIFRLEHGDARDVSRIASQFLQTQSRGRGRGYRTAVTVVPTVSYDQRLNALVVSGSSQHFQLIEQLIEALDRAPDRPDREVQLLVLENAFATDVAFSARAAFVDRPKGEQPVIEADPFSNTVTIIAKKADLVEIEGIIRKLDISTFDNRLQLRMVPLDRIPAEQMARMLQSLYAQMSALQLEIVDRIPDNRKDTKPATTPVPDPSTQTPVPPNPTQPPLPPGVVTNAPPAEPVIIAVEKASNSLVLSGPARELDHLERMITDLSFSFISSDAEFRQFRLKEADPVMVAKTLTELFRSEAVRPQQQGQPRGQEEGQSKPGAQQAQQPQGDQRNPQQQQIVIPPPKIVVVAEPRTRSIIVRAKPVDFILLETVIEQLDAENIPPQLQFRIVPVVHNDPAKLLPLVEQLVTQMNSLRQGEPLSAAVDPVHRAFFLVGRDALLDQVQTLIEELDSPAAVGEAEILVVPLKRARSGQLANLLNQMLKPDGSGQLTQEARELQEQVRRLRIQNANGASVSLDLRKPIKILGEGGQGQGASSGNRIVLASTPDNLTALAAIIDMMDQLPAIEGVNVKIITLAFADASSILRTLDRVFQATGAPPFRREDKPTITVDERTNALILVGDEGAFDLVVHLIEQLDREVPLDLKGIHIIALKNADASGLAPNLQRILDARVQQRAAVNRAQADTLRVIVIADTRSNSLIVGGSQEGFDLVRSLVQELDKTGPGLAGRIRLVPLQNANAGALGRSLIEFFNQRYQATRNREAQSERPVILSDLRSNSLLVSAGIEDNQIIDELLLKLDRKTENPAVSITVLPLLHNDSARVAAMLSRIFDARLRSMSVPGQPALPQDQVDIEPDSLSNALVVSSSPENLVEIRRLVEQLDAEPTATGGVLEVFTLQHADAQRVSVMLRSLVTQGLYRPGTAAGGGRSTRDALAISVDASSNTLFVSASPENLLLVRQLIKQIDSNEFTATGDIRLFQLKNARASHVATVLEQFFRSRRTSEAGVRGGERSLPVTVTPDDRTNAILVTGGRETFAAIERIIEQLDGAEVAAKTNFRVFPLKNSTASKLQAMLQQLFARRTARIQGQPPEPISIVSDAWANALIVGASDEDMPMVESLIERLDNSTPQPGVQVQVFPLAKGDARRVAQTIQSLYRDGSSGVAAPVAVNVDERLNALVISAGEADVQRIAELVKKLDTDSVARIAEIRIIDLKHAQADELALILTRALTTRPPALTEQSPNSQLLLQLIDSSEEGRQLIASALKEGVLITPDRRVNSLIVSAPSESMNLLEKLIARLDSETPQLATIKVFVLKNADARQMADLLTELFRLRAVNPSAVSQRSVQYTLASTNLLATIGESTNVLDSVSAVVGSPAEPVLSVTVDSRTNSLLLGGSGEYLTLAEKIITDLDASPGQERKSEVYRLKNSRAEQVELALRSFLDQERQKVTQILGTDAVGTAQRMLDREVAIVAEPLSNTLLISANPRYFPQFQALIQELDRPQAQVLIQVVLAEVTLDKQSDLGMDWNYVSKGSPLSSTGTDFGVPGDLRTLGGFSSAVTGSNFEFVLRALESDGRLEVLSRPQILTADNMEAMINVGQRVPLVTGSRVTDQGNTINQFAYQNVGVMLTVTPRISPDGFVKMDISTTNSELSSSTVDISPGVQIPIINERRATTTVTVQSGQTIIIGGLISTTDDVRAKRVPFFGNIPGVGALFRSTKKRMDRKELLIVLTPQVLVQEESPGRTITASEMTQDQIRDSTLKEKLKKRDPLQNKVLGPLFDKSLDSPRTEEQKPPGPPPRAESPPGLAPSRPASLILQ